MQPESITVFSNAPVPAPIPAPVTVNATDTPETPPLEAEYIFVKMPNGAVVPVLKSDIHDAASTEKQDAPAKFSVPVAEEQFYVHLADGSVIRVNESDLPTGVATNAPNGHWQRGNKVYTVIGVYPVETVVSE